MFFKSIPILLLLFSFELFAGEYQLLSNSLVGISEVKLSDVKGLYLGSTKFLPNVDEPLVIAILIGPNVSISSISKEVFKLKKRKFDSIWRKKLFSGSAVPPIRLKSSDQVSSFLESNKYGVVLMEKREPSKFNRIVIKDE